ncbi:site-specific integrase [Vibrio pacinii]|uniref:site-specific integrase n=1 Tax=Vibrio pacinii TaxID=170674 RepID=UPI00068E5AEE|nr:site-specific integrase [Vibrio pacinii]
MFTQIKRKIRFVVKSLITTIRSVCSPIRRCELHTESLNTLIKKYIDYKKRDNELSQKTIEGIEFNLIRVSQIWGKHDLREMNREDAEEIRDCLYKYPKNYKKNPILRNLQGLNLIKEANILGSQAISNRSVKKCVQEFSSFCNWAVQRDYIDKNYFYRLKTRRANATDVRYKLDDNDINLIFGMSDYEKGFFFHTYYYWIPLLLRFTGARLNELCQLNTDDIVQYEDIWGIRIGNEFVGQRVKSPNSVRFVPIHNKLLDLGFIDFVQSRRERTMLFEGLSLSEGYYSSSASKWFARRREELGIEKGKCAHSFRHSFIDELKQKGIGLDIIRELVGHSSNSITTSVYSRSYNARILSLAINNICSSHVEKIKEYKSPDYKFREI